MSKRDWRLFINDMLECIERIEKYVSGLSYDDFIKDDKTKDAVVRNLEIIGEAANQIPVDIRKRYTMGTNCWVETPFNSRLLCHRLRHCVEYN